MSTIRDNTATMVVYNYIYQEIISQRLRPGQSLTESSLTNLLGTSRTPVRQALQKLASEGYVVLQENRGAFVEKFTKTEITQLYSLRECFIGYALNQSIEFYDDADFEYMDSCLACQEKAFEECDFEKYIAAVRNFYGHIIDKPGNEYLSELAYTVLNRINVYTCLYENSFSSNKGKCLPLKRKVIAAISEGNVREVIKIHRKIAESVIGFYDYNVRVRGLL